MPIHPPVRIRFLAISALSALALTGAFPARAGSGYLHAAGGKLVDAQGREVRLTGVNWFGFETSNLAPHGLWSRDLKGMLLQIRSLGFNCIRLPFTDAMLEPGAKPSSISEYGTDPFVGVTNGAINHGLTGKTSLELLDTLVRACGELGLKLILDDHSRAPDGYMNEKVWYTDKVPESKWIADWVALAKRYQGQDAVIGCDLDNEPHGKPADGGSTWGGDSAQDWRGAAERCGNAILAANPDLLIVVEGVENAGDSYWWGGNLSKAKDLPIRLAKPEKLVYSAHEYGPEVFQQAWFDDPAFPANMEAIWDAHFGYLARDGAAPVLIGEFGIKDTKSYGGKEGTWFSALLAYMRKRGLSWTFWCWNPNSGDTGGLLTDDWLGLQQWKVDSLKPELAPMVGGGTTALERSRAGRGAPRRARLYSAAGRLRGGGDGGAAVTSVLLGPPAGADGAASSR